MSSIAQELDDTLSRIDAQVAARLERFVREILALTEPAVAGEGKGGTLLELAAHAEPMGILTNADIDRAIHDR